MSPGLVTGLVLLAVAATLGYFRGTRKNGLLAASVSRQLEEVLRPTSTEYVNIGGSIGHNFTYALSGEWTRARGTFTLSPRDCPWLKSGSRWLRTLPHAAWRCW